MVARIGVEVLDTCESRELPNAILLIRSLNSVD